MDDHNEPFAARLVSLRRAANLSITSLADAAGLSRQQISNYESGRQIPSAAALDAICKALKTGLGAFDGCNWDGK